jgi:hypothetical protein
MILLIMFTIYVLTSDKNKNWYSTVCIATDCGLDDGGIGVQALVESRILFSLKHPDLLWAHPTSYPFGTGGTVAGT